MALRLSLLEGPELGGGFDLASRRWNFLDMRHPSLNNKDEPSAVQLGAGNHLSNTATTRWSVEETEIVSSVLMQLRLASEGDSMLTFENSAVSNGIFVMRAHAQSHIEGLGEAQPH